MDLKQTMASERSMMQPMDDKADTIVVVDLPPILCVKCNEVTFVPRTKYTKLCVQCYSKKVEDEKSMPKRACVACGRLKILQTEPSFVTLCTGCYGQRREYESMVGNVLPKRPCVRCGCRKIGMHEPYYKTLCSDCFTVQCREDNQKPKRACSVCAELTIPSSAPVWRNKCKKCFQ